MNSQTESPTRLHGEWLLMARLTWVALAILTLTIVVIAIPDRFDALMLTRVHYTAKHSLEQLGLSIGFYTAYNLALDILRVLVSTVVALFIFWRKSDDWMALFISLTLLFVGPFWISASYSLTDALIIFHPALLPAVLWDSPVEFLRALSWGCFILFFYLFPNGRLLFPWMRVLAVWVLTWPFFPASRPYMWPFIDPLTVFLILFGLGVWTQIYRYSRLSSPLERQQTKWAIFGLAIAISIPFAVYLLATINPSLWLPSRAGLVYFLVGDTLITLSSLLIPVTISNSILRYRLWDIDILINRSLIYFTLIAVITGLYVLVVGSLSGLLQNQSDLSAPLVAFLIIAAFVQPLRRALQNNVNRLLRFDPGRRDESQVALQKSSEPSAEAQEENVQIQEITEVDSSPPTRLHGRWLFSARLAWIAIAILAMVIYAAAAPVAFNQMRLGCGLQPCDAPFQTASRASSALQEQASLEGAWKHTISEAVFQLLTLGVALLIFWRRSDDWMAHLTSIMLVTIFAVFSPSPMLLAIAQPLWHWPRALLWAIALASTVGLFYLFPDGRFVPPWTRSLAIALLVIIGALAAAGAPFLAGFPIFVLALATGAVFQIYRYRRVSSPLQRQQTKWVVLGIIGMVLPMLVFLLFAFLNPSLNPLLSPASRSPQGEAIFGVMLTLCIFIPLFFVPVTLAFSILRYRLWDVDLVINRTLVYGTLTASVVALYVLIVGWLSIGLQTQNYLPGSVFAILVIAFLFQPLRHRLQRIADRFVPVPQSALPLEQHKDKIAITQGAAYTRLRGRWLFITRVAWVIGFITLTIMYALGFIEVREVLSTVCEDEPCTLMQQIRHADAGDQVKNWPGPPVGFADPLRPDQVKALDTLGLTLDQYGWLGALQMGIPVLVFLLIAAGLFWRKSDNWMALFVSMMIATFPFQGMGMPLPFTLAVRQPAWDWVYFPAMAAAVSFVWIFPLIFPTGQFVPRWMRWIAVFQVAGAIIVTWFQDSISSGPAGQLALVYVYISFGAGVYAQLYRYFRVATAIERQQLKWAIVGMAGFISTVAILLEPLNSLLASQAASMDPARALVLSTIPDILFRIVSLFVPVSIVISVLRYRLWDIDIIINRTLVYGALTGVVVSAFVIIVGFLSILFQSGGNSIIAIVATGLIALLFNPLRQRLQRGINHLMYGERDDPYVMLSRLGRRLEMTLAPEAVLPTVVTTVRECLKLPYAAIYLKEDDNHHKIVAESASPSLRVEGGRIRVPGMEREGRCMPLIHQGETVGYIVIGPRASNEAFSATDLRFLEDLAPQVGVAVHAVRLTADLQRSRERLVLAREEERRRLRRDLHDDLGPTLASLGLAASTVADLISKNPTAATKLVKELENQMRATVGNVRRLVYDLRPPTLDELGLLAAVRERATRYSNAPDGFHVVVDAPAELPTLPAAVEVAAYRIVQEALENVSKHSQARICSIRFANHNGLEIEVTDDGIGLTPNITPGVGLRSMRERAEELGGRCVIERGVKGGTRVLAHLPTGDSNGSVARPHRG